MNSTKKIVVLFFLCSTVFCFSQTKSNHSHYKTPGFAENFVEDAKYLYDWHDVENALAKRIHSTPAECNAFFCYIFGKKYVSMTEYLQLVKNGSITKANALQYWLEKLSLFEKLYNEVYLARPLQIQNTNQARQGNNSIQTGGNTCNNLDFSNGTTSGWIGQWNNVGNTTGINAYGNLTVTGLNSSGINAPDFYVHELCSAGHADANVPISTVPPGHNYALRLGDDSAYQILLATGNNPSFLPFNHQTASNTFLVTQANQNITYWYAVVLCQYNPNNHSATIQPYFKIRMYDGSGNEIMCAHYDVDALTASTIGGFQTVSTFLYDSINLTTSQYDFLYKDWSQVMIPLANYIGQNVTLTFETSDCAAGGHPGYAYIEADCAPFAGITFTPFTCGMSTTVLTAPSGVATYSWAGPGIVGSATNQTVTINAGGTYTVNMTTIGNSGITCNFKLDTTLAGVPPAPVANFTTAPVCVGNPTAFTNLSTGNPFIKQIFHFGDGTADSTNSSPTHTYATPGTYTVTLFVNNGCTNTYTTTVTVNPGATASFNAAPVCQGTATNFNNTSTGGSSYNWDFGDGSPQSTIQNPTHTYATSGLFAVTLTVTNSFGCKFITTNSITVNVMPVVSLSAPTACLGNPTPFTNTSTPNTNVNYSWNFGDPLVTTDTSSIKNPSYTYNVVGTYTVSLQVTTAAGCSASANYVVTVNPVPNMTLTTPPPYCWADNVIQPSYTVNPNNTGLSYSWTNSNTQIGLGSSGTGIPPIFIAGLNNTTTNVSGIITVVPTLNGCPGPPATYTITIKPTPIITHTNVDYCPNQTTTAITFTASPAGSSITWINTTPATNIGLVQTNGTSNLPSFTTIDPGTFMVSDVISLQAVLNGCTGPLSTFSINVNPNPVASFTNSVACDGVGTLFTDLSTIGNGAVTQWLWNFGNNNTSNLQNPAYVLTPVGNHTIELLVTSNKGCKDSIAKVVFVNPRPAVNFSGDSLSGCSPLSVHFADSCFVAQPDNIIKWIWNFGNGTQVTDTSAANVSATYTNSSYTQNVMYNVSLTVITNVGCASKLTKNNYITVYPIPLAAFAYTPPDADIIDPLIYFHNQSQGAGGTNSYHWNFGDNFGASSNDTSSLVNPTHEYSDQFPYTYFATLYVHNIYGCKDSVTEPVVIHPAVTFYIPNTFSPNFDGVNDGYKGTGIGIDNSTYSLSIFDRWGMEIFHANDLEQTWDGKFKGVPAQEDTYVWKVYFRDIEKQEHSYKGIVNLIR